MYQVPISYFLILELPLILFALTKHYFLSLLFTLYFNASSIHLWNYITRAIFHMQYFLSVNSYTSFPHHSHPTTLINSCRSDYTRCKFYKYRNVDHLSNLLPFLSISAAKELLHKGISSASSLDEVKEAGMDKGKARLKYFFYKLHS